MLEARELVIVIPMAGHGSRFADAGYEVPKPLITIGGRPMIELVIETVRPSRPHRFVFIAQREHAENYELGDRLNDLKLNFDLVLLDGVTGGAACTVLEAQRHIDTQEPMMIANSDQWFGGAIDDYLQFGDKFPNDSLIMTMKASSPKWSYIEAADETSVRRVVEKVQISDEATVGIYNFVSGNQFVKAAREMIAKDLRVNDEFYIAPVYNQIIENGSTVRFLNVGEVESSVFGLGTPEDLRVFLKSRPELA